MLIIKRAALIVGLVLYFTIYLFVIIKSIGLIKNALKGNTLPENFLSKKKKTFLIVMAICDFISFYIAFFLYFVLSGNDIFTSVLYAGLTCSKCMGKLPTLLLISWLLSLLTIDWLGKKSKSSTDS